VSVHDTQVHVLLANKSHPMDVEPKKGTTFLTRKSTVKMKFLADYEGKRCSVCLMNKYIGRV